MNSSLEKYRNISYTKIKQVVVTDIAGRMVRNMQVNGADMVQVNVAGVVKGIFFVKVTDKKSNIQTQKLMIQ